MSTRCKIGIINKNGSVKAINCQHDGYPAYTGKILLKKYATEDWLTSLLKLGDISLLVGNLDVVECMGNDAVDYPNTIFMFDDRRSDAEYFYLYSVINDKWIYANYRGEFQELTKDVCDRD